MSDIKEITGKDRLCEEDIIRLLSPKDDAEEALLFKMAREVKRSHVGGAVFLRGLIEISNICQKDCYYCGIRKGNLLLRRYKMNKEEVLSAARKAYEWGYGSLTLQSGEVRGEKHIAFIEEIIREIKNMTSGSLGITLSLGEQKNEAYQRWFMAGAHRYLLRIETSNKGLYRALHPEDHSFDHRIECLHALKKIGYQLGTGVMIGLPGQTIENLAHDIIFFMDVDADMIGMGPYVPHMDTPLGRGIADIQKVTSANLIMALKMIAATRIVLKDVNIASATALQAIDENGRERGVMAGANVIMPNMTDAAYRRYYQLYENKPCMDEDSEACRGCLESRIESIGETIGYNQWGDSPHFKKKVKDVSSC